MCLDYRELHTSIKRSSRHPYSINSGSKCCAIYPSLFCSIRQLYRLCCCAIDSKQIGEAGRLGDRKEHRGFADWTEGGSCSCWYSRWTNDEGKYTQTLYTYMYICSSIAIPKRSIYMDIDNTGGRISQHQRGICTSRLCICRSFCLHSAFWWYKIIFFLFVQFYTVYVTHWWATTTEGDAGGVADRLVYTYMYLSVSTKTHLFATSHHDRHSPPPP